MELLLVFAAREELGAVFPNAVSPDVVDWPEHEPVSCALEGRSCTVCLTGVGPVNAAVGVGRALALRPDVGAVVQVGLAGSFDLARAPLGSVWRVQREVWPEYGLAGSAGVDARALGFPQWTGSRGTVWDSLSLPDPLAAGPEASEKTSGGWAAQAGLHCDLPATTAITVAGVTGTPERAARLCSRYGALLENMEGFAVALACARRGIPLLEVRVVSNLVGSRAPEHRAFGTALERMRPTLQRLLAPRGMSCMS